jgi:predicted DNA-binding ribbon-helix-helix protein
MPSGIKKRSITVAGRKTSVSLEDAFWQCLNEIRNARQMSLSNLVGNIDAGPQFGNLSSTIRLFVLDHFRASSSQTANNRGAAGIEVPQTL